MPNESGGERRARKNKAEKAGREEGGEVVPVSGVEVGFVSGV